MPARWRITHQDDVARIAPARGPDRMDLAIHAAWDAPALAEGASLGRYRIALARQIRQDLWRALQDVRGFAPVVEIASDHSGQGGSEAGAVRVLVTAGGRLDVPQAPRAAMEADIRSLLEEPAARARRQRHAALRARPRPEDAL